MNPVIESDQSMVIVPEPTVDREIFRIEGQLNGPNIVFIGGMHGNEPSGVRALEAVAKVLTQSQFDITGNVYGFLGNKSALQAGERFLDEDLNRIWQPWRVDQIMSDQLPNDLQSNESLELKELWTCVTKLMEDKPGPFVFIDLHTTSVDTVPFITMSDTIMNRQFAKRIPVPVVIGIEEYLDEPLLSYVNELGYVSFAFEAGQHDDPISVINHEALIWMILVHSGLLSKKQIPQYGYQRKVLKKNAENNHRIYELRMRQGLEKADTFKMQSGFTNFQEISEGQKLATLNGKQLTSPEKGLIFMPLYQAKGSDAYFIIRGISKFWLGVSFVFRKLNFYRILTLFPGVRAISKTNYVLEVDLKIAKWYSRELLHLMGYRRKKVSGNLTLFLRRKYDLKGPRD